MSTSLVGAPTAELPPIGKIRQTSLKDLQAALCYLGSLYNPEVRLTRRSYRLSGTSPCSSTAHDEISRCHASADTVQKPYSELDAIRADTFERSYAVRWLTTLVARVDQLQSASDETGDAEDLVQQAAGLLAICAGTAAAGTRSRIFAFDRTDAADPIRVELTDLPLDNQDYTSLGAQTWGGACLMAGLIVQSPSAFGVGEPAPGRALRVLELGAGTGLVGLAAGKILETRGIRADVILTDFHVAVLENLGDNATANFSNVEGTVRIPVHPLDWSEVASTSSLQLPPPFDQPFDVVLGADIIYELEHARWIKACLEKLLRVPPVESISALSSSPTLHPEFHLVMPLRSTHATESQTVEQVFPAASSVRSGADSPPEGGPVEKTLAIVAKEVVMCEDFARGSDSEIEYVHFTIAWV